MPEATTKEKIIEKYGDDFPCRVFYKGQKGFVEYSSCKNVNWKNVNSITVIFPLKKIYFNGSENVTRDGKNYRILS